MASRPTLTPVGSKFRRWNRFRLNLPVRLIVARNEGTRIMEGRAKDICEGGLLIFAGVELRGGDKLFLEFTPPYSSGPIRAPAVVRHRRGYHYASNSRPIRLPIRIGQQSSAACSNWPRAAQLPDSLLF